MPVFILRASALRIKQDRRSKMPRKV